MTTSISSLGYSLLIAGVGTAVSFAVKNEKIAKTCCVVANLANSFAFYQAINNPFYAIALGAICMVSCFKDEIGKKAPAYKDSLAILEIANVIAAVSVFFFSSYKLFEIMPKNN